MCRVDMERWADIFEGELCKETPSSDGGRGSEGINKLVVMDNKLVWTGTLPPRVRPSSVGGPQPKNRENRRFYQPWI